MITNPAIAWGNGLVVGRAGLRRFVSRLGGQQDSGPKSCKDFSTQAEAQAYFEARGGNAQNNVDNLDHNHNGIACEVYPYGHANAHVPDGLRPVAGRGLLPGMFAALGWVVGRQQRRA
ncbi:MAG: excalibur calcium-binding domain-containing protein [Chloroflexota bacterium]|nr:excalibur calcium-binding domain-containing protein [Chloroflexota bacterium]